VGIGSTGVTAAGIFGAIGISTASISRITEDFDNPTENMCGTIGEDGAITKSISGHIKAIDGTTNAIILQDRAPVSALLRNTTALGIRVGIII